MPYARDFTAIILCGNVFLHVGFGLNNVIRAQGDPKTALLTQIFAALINVVLNYVFIFICHWGIKGAALATIAAEAFAAVWVLVYFTRGAGVIRFRRKNFLLQWDIVREICKIGIAPFALQIGASAVMVVLNLRIMRFGGEIGVAAFGIMNRVLMLVMMPVIGISQGAQPIIGYNYGARRYRRVVDTLNKALIAATLVCTVSFVLVEVFAEQTILLFNSDEQLVAIGSHGLRVFLLLMPIIGFQIIGSNYFQSVGKAYYSLVLSLSRQVLILIPLVFILSNSYGLTGIWAAGPLSDGVSAILTGICLFFDIRTYRRELHEAI